MADGCSINARSTTTAVAEAFLGIFAALILLDTVLTAIGLYTTLTKDQAELDKIQAAIKTAKAQLQTLMHQNVCLVEQIGNGSRRGSSGEVF